ncbi:taspase, threonine aspartase, 1 [Podochytrium sp. JEL0797]|nr:taspase, threonine aspartase, 1 [Podochytrium sp. JEL0797]
MTHHTHCLSLTPLIAVHSGAGRYSRCAKREAAAKAALQAACLAGVEALASAKCVAALAVSEKRRDASSETRLREALSEKSPSSETHHDSSLAACVAAVSSLENNASTNSAFGANLTSAGSVECDAAAMLGTSGSFGAVAATPNIRNPVAVAAKLAWEQHANGKVSRVLGRVRPVLLVANGAAEWLKGVCSTEELEHLLVKHPDELVSKDALQRWEQIIALLNHETGTAEDSKPQFDDEFEDTVGAVAMDCCGNISSAVSSGGILFKFPGRVGEAAMYGCGVWAQSVAPPSTHLHQPTRRADSIHSKAHESTTAPLIGFGCSLSGTGEQIMQTLLARELATALLEPHDPSSSTDPKTTATDASLESLQVEKAIRRVITDKFDHSRLLEGHDPNLRNVGVLAVRVVVDSARDGEGDDPLNVKPCASREVWVAHTTDSMGVAWMSLGDAVPKTLISRKSEATDASNSRKGKRKWMEEAVKSPQRIKISGRGL